MQIPDLCFIMTPCIIPATKGKKRSIRLIRFPLMPKIKKLFAMATSNVLTTAVFTIPLLKAKESKLYKRDYDCKKATLIYTDNMTFSLVKNLDNTLYFSQFNVIESNAKAS